MDRVLSSKARVDIGGRSSRSEFSTMCGPGQIIDSLRPAVSSTIAEEGNGLDPFQSYNWVFLLPRGLRPLPGSSLEWPLGPGRCAQWSCSMGICLVHSLCVGHLTRCYCYCYVI